MALQPDAEINVKLTAMQWEGVLRVMDEAPLPRRIVNPLFTMIQSQCLKAADPQPEMGQVVKYPQSYPDGA